MRNHDDEDNHNDHVKTMVIKLMILKRVMKIKMTSSKFEDHEDDDDQHERNDHKDDQVDHVGNHVMAAIHKIKIMNVTSKMMNDISTFVEH